MTEHSDKPVPPWLLALGENAPPPRIYIEGRPYEYRRTFKHDFFALTALYEGEAGKVVLKAGRQRAMCGVPMQWLGILLRRHEARLMELCRGLHGVPALLGGWGPTGLIHDYVEGRPLRRVDRPADDFFPSLDELLNQLHARGIAYVDLEKPENILFGDDGRPHLIDFQISWHLPAHRLGESAPARAVLRLLQASDRYHLLKHWRKLRPDQLSGRILTDAERLPWWIRWHRRVFRPITLIRRQILVWMGLRSSVKVRSPG